MEFQSICAMNAFQAMIIEVWSQEICSMETLKKRRHVGGGVEGPLGSWVKGEWERREEKTLTLD